MVGRAVPCPPCCSDSLGVGREAVDDGAPSTARPSSFRYRESCGSIVLSQIQCWTARLFLVLCLLWASVASDRAAAVKPSASPTLPADELSLSGEDWQLASFEPGVGLKHLAFGQGFPGSHAVTALVPGDVHWDLERAGKIPPIYYGQNSKEIGWVAGKEWWYRKSFRVPETWRAKRVWLRFGGIDYRSEVWLNGVRLGEHEGQFTPFEFEASQSLRLAETNILTVLVHAAPAEVRQAIADGAGEWAVMQALRRAYSRWKCQTNAGWDWGAKIITVGIWQEVRLIAAAGPYVSEVTVLPELSAPYDQAQLRVKLRVTARHEQPGRLHYAVESLNEARPAVTADQAVALLGNTQEIALSIPVAKPLLWWPNGYGPQNLYRLRVWAETGPGVTGNVATVTFGIRDLQMLANPSSPDNVEYIDYTTDQPVTHKLDASAPERKYLIQINGRKIFARGGNWIPCDLLYGRPRRPFYEHLIRSAALANFNLFRMWGGGLIEKPEFYELCDRYGILLFQEFPNAGVRLPEDDAALASYAAETRQILPQLMNHPSIVRYGGGNEWYRNGQNSRQMAQLRRICGEMDPTRPFHDPDPECIAQRHGPHSYDYALHYQTYNRGYPLTAGPDNPLEWTEYGASGAASVDTLRVIMPAASLWPVKPTDPNWNWHKAFNAYGADNWLGSAQYLQLFDELPDLETTVRASQFVQAEGLRYANQSMRRFKWHRSACASWTYNEPWPNAAHGCVIEYYGRPKMAYYYTRDAYAPVDVSAEYPSLVCRPGVPFPLKLFVTSDRPDSLKNCRLTAAVIDVRGREYDRKNWSFDIPSDATGSVGTLDLNPPDAASGSVLLVQLQLADSNGRRLSTQTYTFGVAGQNTERPNPLQVPAVSPEGRRNLALLPKAKAAASSVLAGYAIHQIAHLNNGWYGNEASWIAGAQPAWAQIDLSAPYTISRVCVGNDHSQRFTDRGAREFRVQVATEYREHSSTPTWQTVATYKGDPLQGGRQFDFPRVTARWVRIHVTQPAGVRIDEIEVYEAEPLPVDKVAAANAVAVRGPAPIRPEEAVPRGCLRALLRAPETQLELSVSPRTRAEPRYGFAQTFRATVRNRGNVPALFVKLDLDGFNSSPSHIADNYFTLLPGEAREVEVFGAQVGAKGNEANPSRLRAQAWNSAEISQSLGRAGAPLPATGAQTIRAYQAEWIWAKVERTEPFQFVRFRKTFDLAASVEKATAFVTADTFHRLWINGELAMHGPARSSVGKATVDPVDVVSFLKPGPNTIEAEALHYNGRFEALGQAPGFLCELELAVGGERRVVATDNTWEAREVAAWSRQSPRHSFQRTWLEDFDSRLEQRVVWQPAVVLGPVGMAPWKTVSLRDVPLPNPRQIFRPIRVLGTQRGDGSVGDLKGTPELESTRYGARPDWCRRLQTEQVKPDSSATTNPQGVTADGRGDAILKGDGASIVYDLGANQVGFFGFELNGAAGQIFELVWNESLADKDQTVRPIQGIEATQALRYVLRDGRQTYLAFNPFLARYVRVVQRGAGEIVIHRLWLADYSFAPPAQGDFQCSDAGLNRIFQAAARTAKLNTLDTFMDNPSRERGAWMREAYWTAQSIYTVFGDLSVSRRMVRQGADSQHAADRAGPPGMVQMLYPAANIDRSFIPAHALYWALQAGLHERIAGDVEFVREIMPAVRQLLEAFKTWRNREGLLENVTSWNFLDWATIRADGVSVALNAMYARTLDQAARLERTIGEEPRAEQYERAAAGVRESLNRGCAGELFFPDALIRNADHTLAPSRETCEATQYFVLWADVPATDHGRRMWQALREDFLPTPGHDQSIRGLTRAGLYSFFERLQVAARFGDHDAVVRDVKAMFQPMADSSPGTLWEHPLRQWCLCQGFCSGVATILTEEVLGIRLDHQTRITPHAGGSVRWCKGHVTTPRGRIAVAWDWKADRYELDVTLPPELTAEVVLPAEAEAVWRSGPSTNVWPGTIQVAGHRGILIQPGKVQ